MAILGLGVDLVEVARFERECSRHGSGFLQEILLPSELESCWRDRRPHAALSARFAAKEALFKALGTGRSGRLSWLDLEVRLEARGRATLAVSGEAARLAADMGVAEIRLSLTISARHAAAMVVLSGRETRREAQVSTAAADLGVSTPTLG
jgi:holo-[acyl-carrier protein] synthase